MHSPVQRDMSQIDSAATRHPEQLLTDMLPRKVHAHLVSDSIATNRKPVLRVDDLTDK